MNQFNQLKIMGFIFYSVLLLFIIQMGDAAWAKEAKGERGKKSSRVEKQKQVKRTCSEFTHEDTKDVLRKLDAPDATVVSLSDSAIKGVCEVIIENKGRSGIFYIDLERKHILVGSLITIDSMVNVTAEKMRKIKDSKRVNLSAIPLKEALIVGEQTASKKVIVFTDPDCDFCGQLHQTAKQIVAKRKDIAFLLKFFPLDLHKDAYWKAKSIVCSKSIKMLEENFDKKEIKKTECQTQEIDDSIKLAMSLGFSGTPSIILPDGRIREGALPEAELLDLIDGKK